MSDDAVTPRPPRRDRTPPGAQELLAVEPTGVAAGPLLVTRRTFLTGAGSAAAALALGGTTLGRLLSADEARAGVRRGTAGTLTLSEGSMLQLALSPDGDTIALNLLGMLWLLDASGGEAVQITDVYSDVAYPQWSPQGDRIAFQSYLDGTYHIWTVAPDGSDLRQLTDGGFDDREPVWSPDGSQIAFASDRDNAGQQRSANGYDIWVVDVASGAVRRVTRAALGFSNHQPAWAPNGSEIAYVESGSGVRRILAIDADGQGSPRVLHEHSQGTLHTPRWSPSGDRIAYVWSGPPAPAGHDPQEPVRPALVVAGERVSDPDEDVYPYPPEWVDDDTVLYPASGRIRRRELSSGAVDTVPFTATLTFDRPAYTPKRRNYLSRTRHPVKGIANPVLSPDGRTVAFVALNQLWTLEVDPDGSGQPVPLTDDVYYKATPFWSPDGSQLAYSTDRDGPMAIYIRDMATGEERKLTGDFPLAQVRGAWSPDGRTIAFVSSTNGRGDASIHLADVETGEIRQLLEPLFEPGRPTWGPNSDVVALAVWEPYSNRFREGQSLILTVDVDSGERTLHNPYPFSTISNRKGDLGPVWSPDGRWMAYVLEDQLYVLPVDERGTPTGEQRRLTDEVADMISWSGDSSTLLYLSNGTLRTVPVTGGEPTTVPLHLRWQQDVPRGQQVIHAGALWDGVSEQLRRDVDILVHDNRIRAVRDHDPRRRYGSHVTVVDASDLTVLPGLWECHGHEQMDQPYVGGRKGRFMLSQGITTVMGMGDPAYESLEQVESERSGARLTPRFLWAAEAIDGERNNYDFMRATVTEASLERQLERIRALEPDIVKMYVRLKMDWQERVIAAGHELGIPSFSHYTFPAMPFGMDCCSHWATQRLGYHLTMSASSAAYDDTVDLYAQSQMGIIITRGSAVMLRTYPGFLEDRRMQQLLTPWQYEQMRGQHDQQQSEASLADYREFLDGHRRILRAGGLVLTGTDEPLSLNVWGLQPTVAGLVAYGGFTTVEALRTVTSAPAKVMGLEGQLGTVETGALADLVFVRGNPLTRIQDLWNVEMVMKNGRLHTIDDLIEPYAASGPAGAHRPAALAAPAVRALTATPGAASAEEVDYGAEWYC
ncbi:MAG TPA: amidohydrolase family protein [Egibacteraceae bacterium]